MSLSAIKALVAVGQANDPVVDALATVLKDPKVDIRKEAARALGVVDTVAPRTSAAFQKATKNLLRVMKVEPDPEVRFLASSALLKMMGPLPKRKGL